MSSYSTYGAERDPVPQKSLGEILSKGKKVFNSIAQSDFFAGPRDNTRAVFSNMENFNANQIVVPKSAAQPKQFDFNNFSTSQQQQ